MTCEKVTDKIRSMRFHRSFPGPGASIHTLQLTDCQAISSPRISGLTMSECRISKPARQTYSMSMIAMACMAIANDGQFPAMRPASSLRVPNSGSLALLYKLDCQANGLLASPGVCSVLPVSTVCYGVTIVTRSSYAWRIQSVLLIPSHSMCK